MEQESFNLTYYRFFYEMGCFSDADIEYATDHAVLTPNEYKIITGKDYIPKW